MAVRARRERRRADGWLRRGTAVAAIALLGALGLAACDWTQPGFGPGKGFYNPDSTLTPGTVGSLRELRSIPVPTGSTPAPIVLRSSVVVTSQAASTGPATVSSYSTSTGAQQWSTTVLAASAGVSAPVAWGSAVLVGAVKADGNGLVAAVAVADGSVRWTRDLAATCTTACSGVTDLAQTAPSLTLVGGKVVVVQDTRVSSSCTGDYWRVSALDAASGAVSWAQPAVEQGSGPPGVAAAGSTVLLAYALAPGVKCSFVSEFLHDQAFDPNTGALTWSVTLALGSGQYGVALAPAFVGANGRYYGLYLTNEPEQGFGSFDADTGQLLGPSLAGETSAVTGSLSLDVGASSIVATRLTDESVRWSAAYPTGSVGHLGPTVAGQVVYAVTDDGTSGFSLRTFDLGTGAALGAVAVAGSDGRPVVANGHAFLIAGTTLHIYGVA
jgi:hypothetical protein